MNKRIVLFFIIMSSFIPTICAGKKKKKSFFQKILPTFSLSPLSMASQSRFSLPSFENKKDTTFVLNSEKDSPPVSINKKKKKIHKPSKIMQHVKNGVAYLKSDEGKQKIWDGVKYMVPIAVLFGGGYQMYRMDRRLQEMQAKINQPQQPVNLQPVQDAVGTVRDGVNGVGAHLQALNDVPGQLAAMQPQLQQIADELPHGHGATLAQKDDVRDRAAEIKQHTTDQVGAINDRIDALATEVRNRAFGIKGITRAAWTDGNIEGNFRNLVDTSKQGLLADEKINLQNIKYFGKYEQLESLVPVIGHENKQFMCLYLKVWKQQWGSNSIEEEWPQRKQKFASELHQAYNLPNSSHVVIVAWDEKGKKWL